MKGLKRAAVVVAGMAILSSFPVIGGPASASSFVVPFHDQYQDGTITLCNKDGQVVKSGSVNERPFVWSAISSTPAPSGYKGANLYVFQPIQHVDPGAWAGYQMNDQAFFTNPAHPVSESTYFDNPLVWAVQTYPPYWDGLYELRIAYDNPGKSQQSSPYPAAVIRVTGNTWTLLQGGGTPCNAGTAVSDELTALPKYYTARSLPANGPGRFPSAGSGTAGVSSPSNPVSYSSSTVPAYGAIGRPSSKPSGPKVAAAAADKTDSGGSIWPIVVAIVGGLVLAALASVWFRRKKRLSLNRQQVG